MWRNQLRILASVGVAVFGLLFSQNADAAARIKRALLRSGGSIRLMQHDWACLKYEVENPDNRPVRLRLAVVPRELVRGTVAETVIDLPAKRKLGGQFYFPASGFENYDVVLYEGSRRIDREDVLAKTASNRQILQVINDDFQISGIGDLKKLGGLESYRLEIRTSRGGDAPDNWMYYNEPLAVVILNPDYEIMSSGQLEALVTYVQRGGTLLFLNPEGVLKALNTPLAALLPVQPLQIRNLEKPGAFFQELGNDTRLPDSPVAFLDSLEAGAGLTTFSWQDYPVFRWKRCGLGRVGVLAVNPFDQVFKRSPAYETLWRHLLAHCQKQAVLSSGGTAPALPRLNRMLIGTKTPSVGYVQRILIVYMGIMIVALIAGMVTRRQLTVWLVLAAFGVVTTGWILNKARDQYRGKAAKTLACITVAHHTPTVSVQESVLTANAVGESREVVKAASPETVIRDVPPVASFGYARNNGDQTVLQSQRVNGHANLPRFHLRALKPTSFLTASQSMPEIELNSLPELEYTPSGVNLPPWQLPSGLTGDSITSAMLCLPNGFVPLTLKNGVVSGQSGVADRVQLNTFVRELQELLKYDGVVAPALVFVHGVGDKTVSQLPVELEGFVPDVHRIDVVPVQEKRVSEAVHLPAESVCLSVNVAASRMLYLRNQWQMMTLSSADSGALYALEAAVPAVMAKLSARRVVVQADISNAGGNLNFEFRLIPGRQQLEKRRLDSAWQAGVKPVSVDGQTYAFELPETMSLIDPATGKFSLLLRVSPKRALKDAMDAQRTNRWQVQAIRASVGGDISASLNNS